MYFQYFEIIRYNNSENNSKMNLLSKTTSKCLIFYNVVVVILIVFQINNSVTSQLEDLNLTDDNYASNILRRSKRQRNIVSNCQIPNYGLHTRYAILGESTSTTYQSGDYAQQFNTLEVSCDGGYKLKPFTDKRTICINGQWNPPLAINCSRTCPSLTSTISTTVRCKYHDIPLENCINPIEETTALLTCNSLYEQYNLQNNRIHLCRRGRWIPGISECYPICGIKRPKGRANIVNGQNATSGDFPWQIGIYNAQKEFICGGSILDRHIILTAAHCVADHYGNVQPVDNYYIAAGKYYRKYDDDKDEYAQYSKVLQIYVPERYTGLSNNFALDIAILILTDPYTISVGVQPLCIELNEKSPYLHLSLNSNGVVTGWGYTAEGRELSEVLKELVIPYVPFRKCFEEVPDKFRRFITTDKICGGYLNNETSVCGGDSGGALVFKNILSDRYYVKGIVSTSPGTEELTCDSNQYSLYTSVDHHVDFIRNILIYNQMPQSIEFTAEDVADEETDESRLNIDHCTSEYLNSEMLNRNSSEPPQIIPKSPEVTINASLTFKLRCFSKNLVTWTYPNNVEEILKGENLTKYSTITNKTSKCDEVYESVLTISNASYLDVGFYYCHESTTDNTDSTKTKNSSIYVFVHDDAQLYLMPKYINLTLSQHSRVIWPCRSTAPDVSVKLMTNTDDVEVPRRYSYYDSKIGFEFKQTSAVGDYSFRCIFSRGHYVQTTNVDISVTEPNCNTDSTICHLHAVCLKNFDSKYICKCRTGYFGSGTECQKRIAQEGNFLLLSRGQSILRIPYNRSENNLATVIYFNPAETAVGLDVDCLLGHIYWSDVNQGTIKRSKYNGSNVVDFITSDIGTPESLSIDWIARNIYWTDTLKDTIEVANIDTKLRTVLFNTDLVNPRGIAVHPQRGKIFWTDWNRHHPKIEWANADGTGREIFLEGENIQLPNMLSIDFETERLCYTDAGTHKLECLDIDTRYKETIAENCNYPFGIAVTSNHVYWSDWNTQEIERVDKHTLKRLTSLNVSLGFHRYQKIYGLLAVPQRCLNLVNSCQHNIQCPLGHICVPDGNGSHSCLCGYKADAPNEKSTC